MTAEARDHKDSEPGTRSPQPAVADLARELTEALERLQAHVRGLLEAVEAESEGLVQLSDDDFAEAQLAKEEALEGIAQARSAVVRALSEMELLVECEAGTLAVASLDRFVHPHDWTYVKALGESISATLEAAQAKGSANAEMVQVRLGYFDFLSNLILKTWESESGCSASGGESVSVIVDRRA